MGCRYEEGAVTEPATWLADFKTYARINFTGHDTLLSMHLQSAREWFERHTLILTASRTLTLHLDGFPAGVVEVNRTPLASITRVDYRDLDGVVQTLAGTEYQVDLGDDRTPARLLPEIGKSWPSTQGKLDDVQIVTVAGYATIGDLPARYLDPIFAYAADLYNGLAVPSPRAMALLQGAQREVYSA